MCFNRPPVNPEDLENPEGIEVSDGDTEDLEDIDDHEYVEDLEDIEDSEEENEEYINNLQRELLEQEVKTALVREESEHYKRRIDQLIALKEAISRYIPSSVRAEESLAEGDPALGSKR